MSSTEYFPNIFVEKIIERLKYHLKTDNVFPRTLGVMEADDAIGVYVASWMPVQETKLMGGGLAEATINRYVIKIQNLRVDGDEVEGRRLFNITCRKIRAILARDPELSVTLPGLSEELLGTVERVKKYDVTRQDFMNARLDVGVTFLCTTEVQIETESTRTP